MNKCKKYRIKEFPFNGIVVYCPQKKIGWFFWVNMNYDTMNFNRLKHIPDFVISKQEAAEIIQKDKERELNLNNREKKNEEFKRKFGPPKYECVD